MSQISGFMTVAKMVRPEQAILLRGPTGIGKSAVVRQFADAIGLPMIDVRTAVMQEGDFNGIPNIERIRETGIASNAMYGWFTRACKEAVVLFLDEFPRAMLPVLQGSLQLVLDRELSNDETGKPYRLHPETRVIAAGNFGEEYEGEDLDPAMLRRFLVLDLDPTADEWIDWAKGEVDPIMVEFIKEHRQFLRGDPKANPGSVCPNPATWHQLSLNYEHAGIAPKTWAGSRRPEGAFLIAQGMVGFEATGKLMDFIERYELLLSAEQILNNFSDDMVQERVNGLDTADHIELAEKVVGAIIANPKLKASQAENFEGYAKVIPAEIFMKVYAQLNAARGKDKVLDKLLTKKLTFLQKLVIENAKAAVKVQTKATHAKNGKVEV